MYEFFNSSGLMLSAYLPLGGLLSQRVRCLEKDPPAPPHYPFWFKSYWHAHDVPALRRGYEVYRQVCATCHSMQFMAYRTMVNTIYPERRCKEIAASFDMVDGPNDEGEMYTRPGVLTDYFPSPYPNDEAARYANNGACPPDLSQYAAAKHGGCDYIMSIITCYREPPAGITLRAGLYYNTYFPGGAFSMPPPLADGCIEFEDGTPATVSQMAKDVASFLSWAQEPIHDERKLTSTKMITSGLIWVGTAGFWWRLVKINLTTRRFDFVKTKF